MPLIDSTHPLDKALGNRPSNQLGNKLQPNGHQPTIDSAAIDSAAIDSTAKDSTAKDPNAADRNANPKATATADSGKATTSPTTRAIKFGIVGLSGVVVNLACTWVAYNFIFQGWGDTNRHGAAFLSGITVSIVTNYLLNAGWTWRERKHASTRRRTQFLKFAAVAAGAAALQFGIAMTLALGLDQAYMLAQTVGIGLASALNFVANNAWTFRHRHDGATS